MYTYPLPDRRGSTQDETPKAMSLEDQFLSEVENKICRLFQVKFKTHKAVEKYLKEIWIKQLQAQTRSLHRFLREHLKYFEGGFLSPLYVSKDTPRGIIEAVLKEFPEDLIAGELDAKQDQIVAKFSEFSKQLTETQQELKKVSVELKRAKQSIHDLESHNLYLNERLNYFKAENIRLTVELHQAREATLPPEAKYVQELEEKVQQLETETNQKSEEIKKVETQLSASLEREQILLEKLALYEAAALSKPDPKNPRQSYRFAQTS